MRAISLTQPWCGLMAAGIKLIENRDQPLIAAKNFGEPLALHATRVYDRAVDKRIFEIAPELAPRGPYSLSDARWYQLSQILSAIIATAVVERVIKAIGWDTVGEKFIYDPEDLEGIPREQRRFMFGRYCYVFKPSPIVLPTAVKTRGWQGHWGLPPSVEEQVRAQLALAKAA